MSKWCERRGRAGRVAFLLLFLAGVEAQAQSPAAITGCVRDSVSKAPILLATVRVMGTDRSMLTDDIGCFRFQSAVIPVDLDVRQIGYRPVTVHIDSLSAGARREIYLRPVAFALAPLTIRGTDDAAIRIIRSAIARKHALVTTTHDYQYQAYVKFAVRDLARPQDSAASVLLITESRSRIYWEQPDHYQETILARRQTGNLRASQNLVTAGEIANFQRERIEFRQFSVVSPIADDALDRYRYAILDTLMIDGQRVFRLAMTPRSEATPLFVGTVDIADSTFDLAGIDVGFDRAVHFTALHDLRYRQLLRQVVPGHWMPYRITLSGALHLSIPLPRLPHDLAFEHAAELSDFEFDRGNAPADLGEVRIAVDPAADRPDSAAWAATDSTFPLSPAERAAWQRIDSVARRPPDFSTRARRGIATSIGLLTDPTFFHFNRVEGAYIGLGAGWDSHPGLGAEGRAGYATGSDEGEFSLSGRTRLSTDQRTWLGLEYHDQVVTRPTFVSGSYNPTVRALLFRIDPLDYYRERGVTLSLTTKLADFTDLELRYDNEAQSTLPVVTDYSVFGSRRPIRPNIPIADGELRTLGASITYDSRPMRRTGTRTDRLPAATWTRVSLGAELAAPTIIPDDFTYQRYALQVQRRQRTLGLGVTTITAAAGIGSGTMPPQRYFTIDFGMKALTYQSGGFNTLGDTNYAGTRAAMIAVQHDFDRLLFARSHLPLIDRLPFTLSVQGGVFWTDFVDHAPQPADLMLLTAPRGYGEVGFGLGNLTPFLSPFNLAAHFTWSLNSRYAADRRMHFGLSFFGR
ncbi:MAG TPA: DUF5686 family protein [Gemmatimonadales bacterium]|nr:DUF5686 family protein [Gemmatimonadales bacterium]